MTDRNSHAMRWRAVPIALIGLWCVVAGAPDVHAQGRNETGTLEIYGFGQADAIADFKQNNPDWFDTNRPSKLPNVDHQFGKDGHFYLSARQSLLGAKAALPTSNGDVTAQFEFDMLGSGRDAGQTTIRLRHAWGQWKNVGAGMTNSPFMDADAFPNVIDAWGPNGMVGLRNVQVFYEPYRHGDSHARIAIENPGASLDGGVLTDRIELQNTRSRFPLPDLTGHFRLARQWGYLQIGGALRKIAYDDLLDDQFDLSGSVWGWGVAISSNLKPGPHDVLRLQVLEGAGVENYINDAPVDVSIKRNPGNVRTPIVGEALGDFGLVLYFDHTWTDRLSSAVGYSRVDISNSDGQVSNAYRSGQYASVNLLSKPATNVMMGGEFQWARRENFADGFSVNDYRLQFSFKYSFSYRVGGQP